MMMTAGLQASARQPARASARVYRDIGSMAMSWNPVPPAGVSGTKALGGRTFVDDVRDAHDPFLVPPGADCRKNSQFIQLRKRY